jgi:uncharacterized protein (DUF983 family)
MNNLWKLLWRGLRLRCPVCGKGKLFRGFFKMYEACPVCHFIYEREEGYFTSSMAINIVISELIVTGLVVPFAIEAGLNPNIPFIPIMILGSPLPIILPILFYRHSRSLWMSLDHLLNPPEYVYRADEHNLPKDDQAIV